MGTVYHAVMDVITQVMCQGPANDVKGSPLVVRDKVLDVLQQKGTWPLLLDDAGDIEEQGALRFASEAMCFAERIFLLTPAMENGWQGKPASRTS